MKTKFFFSLLCVASLVSGSLQAQGLIFDQGQFDGRQKVGVFRGTLPTKYSLKAYTPIMYPQVGSTCVGHTFSNARTILLAKSLKWTDKKKITGLLFSPYFVYYRSKDANDLNCEQGLNIEKAAQDVLQNGFAPIVDVEYPNFYPFTKEALCVQDGGNSYPPSMAEDVSSANRFKVDAIYGLRTVKELKTALSKGMPVVLCMFVPKSFYGVKTDVWSPLATDKFDTNMGHAILAVGYDDTKYGGAIELMNSWGDTWGNKGFTHVRYKDFEKWFMGGYAFYTGDNPRLTQAINNAFNNNSPQKANLSSSAMQVSRDHGKVTVDFDNSQLIEAFKKD